MVVGGSGGGSIRSSSGARGSSVGVGIVVAAAVLVAALSRSSGCVRISSRSNSCSSGSRCR